VDIIYHMNTRLLFDVENLVKYNKNGLSKQSKTLSQNNDLILSPSDLNLIPQPITRIRKNSFCIQSRQIQHNTININNETDIITDDVVGLTIEEIQKGNENGIIFDDSQSSDESV